MKKQINLQENLLKIIKNLFFILSLIIFSNKIYAKEKWVLDKDLSTIEFELPVFLLKNVEGKFNKIEGLVEIDINEKKNNKAIFSIYIDSVEINYEKYKDLLLSEIFFHEKKFPLALIDTNKFQYNNEKEINLIVELNIKGINHNIPISLQVINLTEDLVQIIGNINFNRSMFNIGTGNWSSTTVLKDTVKIKTNLFFFRN
tara:strand:- start:18090 stop:18692 length:603 start_codon:yes stop_codon:yes gene_type:complete